MSDFNPLTHQMPKWMVRMVHRDRGLEDDEVFAHSPAEAASKAAQKFDNQMLIVAVVCLNYADPLDVLATHPDGSVSVARFCSFPAFQRELRIPHRVESVWSAEDMETYADYSGWPDFLKERVKPVCFSRLAKNLESDLAERGNDCIAGYDILRAWLADLRTYLFECCWLMPVAPECFSRLQDRPDDTNGFLIELVPGSGDFIMALERSDNPPLAIVPHLAQARQKFDDAVQAGSRIAFSALCSRVEGIQNIALGKAAAFWHVFKTDPDDTD